MPAPNVKAAPDENEEKNRPKPLVKMPVLSVMSDAEDDSDESSSSDAEDMMTAEEEAAAKRYLSGAAGQTERRMSSLDVYLAQPQATAESLIINRRRSVREEEEAIARMNAEEAEKKAEEARKEKLEREREAVKRERREKSEQKRLSTSQNSSPAPRRRTFKKRGFGGLSKERRKKLKEIIMRKAKEELQAERLKELHARENHLNSVVPPLKLDGLTEAQLKELLQNWHSRIRESFQHMLDWEERIRKQDEEIQELTSKLIDIKGKYPLPILRKVPKKENILAHLEKLRAINATHVFQPEKILRPVTKNTETGATHSGMVNGLQSNPTNPTK